MPIVQCRAFSHTVTALTPASIADGLAQLQAEVNTFIAALPFDSVLDIQYSETPLHRESSHAWLLCRAWVTYLT